MDAVRKYAGWLGAAALLYIAWKKYGHMLRPADMGAVEEDDETPEPYLTRGMEARVREIAREVAREEVAGMSSRVEGNVRRSLENSPPRPTSPPPYNATGGSSADSLGRRRF